ncbi:hypothetical protein DACRYDRAFT_103553 [Dacryopinax primogenitus]|uniref:Vacuolar membrane protein n=1 Tax=Dacryopinax primogenitus (strain DJM 731) TaxID=1858805 RepID=M5GH47_DACPD|nr:uncharacterized protein DACRYDRAFT_103553 [Dacryopinax primogenitus]EJU06608.1 hypothetical protein DACRYDRAFT_103553 [Dacryopinax primogenitus]
MINAFDRPGHTFIPRQSPLEFQVDPSSCSLMGPTAIVVQLFMGALVLLSLVYKRQRERPMRAWRIWAFDVGKQVIGQATVHVTNIIISWIGASNGTETNACSWYLVNILVDTTIGVGLIYVALHGLTNVLSERLRIPGLVSGEYGNPPQWSFFFRQLVVYLFSLAFMKVIVLGLFALVPEIMRLGDWMLEWTASNWALQVILVMGIVPITMNVIQFWLIDSIVMSKIIPFASNPVPVTDDLHEPLMYDDVPERDFDDEGATLTGKRILDDLEAQRGNGNEGKVRAPTTTRSPPPTDRRSSSTTESYNLRPISRENSNHAGSSTNAGFKVPKLHLTKPSGDWQTKGNADWEWNAQDEWGEDPFDGEAQGSKDVKANGLGKKGAAAVQDTDDAADDAWESMDGLDGPKAR